MTPPFNGASAGVLRTLADAFRAGRLGATASRLTLGRVCHCPEAVVAEVTRLLGEGMAPGHLALLLDAHADAIEAQRYGAQPVELVWTGPETTVSYSRDTSVVVRELFESAQRSVLVSTFVVRQGKAVFEALGRRMGEFPDLRVQIFLHVGRDYRDTRHESELLREFADDFRRNWPGERHPDVYYDPRALAVDSAERATWHAKCVLVDDEIALHRLFDTGYLTVTPDHHLEVSVRLKQDFDNGKSYYPLHGLVVSVPKHAADCPDSGLLGWHNQNVFLG